MRISHKHKLIGVSIPKCGSHTIFKLMENNFNGIKHGSFHHVSVPDNCKDYAAFTFVRNPYNRAVSLYNMLTNIGFTADIMRAVNHEFYKQEVEDLSFTSFCKWLGNCPEESMIYEASTSQYNHLLGSNISNIYKIKIEEQPLNNLNKFLYNNNLSGIYELPHELESEHEGFNNLADEKCIRLINKWAKEDFEEYGYEQLVC